jgi:Zn-dependent protease with chaperone function
VSLASAASTVKHSVIRYLAAWLLVGGLLAAPAAGAQPAPEASTAGTTTLRQADARIAEVAYRLALAGRSLCPISYPLTGILFHHLAEYLPADRPRMIALYGLDRGPGILTVLGGSPAAAAGLVAGDTLLAVNGEPFPSPTAIAAESDPKRWRPMTQESERRLEDALRAGPARLHLLRRGRELDLALTAIPACPARVRLAYSSQVNAFSNAGGAVVTIAMLRFVHNDDELAVVLGHELSHGILGHPPMTNSEGLLASFGFRAGTFWHREEEADRLGLRLMAAAGYDLAAAIPFWRRYLGKYDWYPQLFRSHPSLAARENIVREEIEAIGRQKGAAAR